MSADSTNKSKLKVAVGAATLVTLGLGYYLWRQTENDDGDQNVISSGNSVEDQKENSFNSFEESVEDFRQHMKNAGFNEIEVRVDENQKLVNLVGNISVRQASHLNIAVAEFASKQSKIERISRLGLTYVFPHPSTESQYYLSENDEDLTEYYDGRDNLKRKVKFLANLIRKSKHMVVYTGAGISTAADIPDFRGQDGVWTRQDRGLENPEGIVMEQANPTYAHYALVKLFEEGYLNYISSQNVDGLHRKSGVDEDQISELHGNCFKETCASCGKEYLRSYDVCNLSGEFFKDVVDELSGSGISHITGRKCDDCEGMLRDSVIHFGDKLPDRDLDRAQENATNSDLALCLGSSLKVPPAKNLPEECMKNLGQIVIVNLQKTGKDIEALKSGGILINHHIDVVMEHLLIELGIEFPREVNPDDPDYDKDFEKIKVFENITEKKEKFVEEKKPVAAKPLPESFYVGNETFEKTDNSSQWNFVVSSEESSIVSCSEFIENVQFTIEDLESKVEIEVQEDEDVFSHGPYVSESPSELSIKITFHAHLNREPLIGTHFLNLEEGLHLTELRLPMKKKNMNFLAAIHQGPEDNLNKVDTKVRLESGKTYVEKAEDRD